MKKINLTLISSLFLILAIFLVIAIKKPSIIEEKSLPVVLLPAQESCFEKENQCINSDVVLHFPTPIPVAQSFEARVEFKNHPKIEKVRLALQGVEMDMRHLEYVLQEKTPGVFGREVLIPICLTGKMKWRAVVKVDTKDKQTHIPFEFWAG